MDRMEIQNVDWAGAMARSLAGHDKGEFFVIIRENEEYVFLADGKLRTMDKPKRKKKKHIQIIHEDGEQRRKSLIQGNNLTDMEIRKSIRCYKRESQV
jgi:ribosomal protein L14E/L6E/L27E